MGDLSSCLNTAAVNLLNTVSWALVKWETTVYGCINGSPLVVLTLCRRDLSLNCKTRRTINGEIATPKLGSTS